MSGEKDNKEVGFQDENKPHVEEMSPLHAQLLDNGVYQPGKRPHTNTSQSLSQIEDGSTRSQSNQRLSTILFMAGGNKKGRG